MEKSPSTENDHENREDRELRELGDLHALSEIFGLIILREEKFNGVIAIVVDNGRGEEVHIGFPDGTHIAGKKVSPATTGTIFLPRVKMGMYGHGAWRRSIDI